MSPTALARRALALGAIVTVALSPLATAAVPGPYDVFTLAPIPTPHGEYTNVRVIGLAEDDTLVAWARGARPPAITHPTYCKDFAVRFHPTRPLEVIHDPAWKTQAMVADATGTFYGMVGPEGNCKSFPAEPRLPYRYRSAATGFEPLLQGADAAVRGTLMMRHVNSSGLIAGFLGHDTAQHPLPWVFEPATGWRYLPTLEPFPDEAIAIPMELTEQGHVGVTVARPGGFQEAVVVGPDGTAASLGSLGFPVTVMSAIQPDGTVHGCARLANTPAPRDHAFRYVPGTGITDAHPAAEWHNSCSLAATRLGNVVGIADRSAGAHGIQDLYLQRRGWGLHVLRSETLQALLPEFMSFVGATWIDVNDSQEVVGEIQVFDTRQPTVRQAREVPFYHHPRLGTFLLATLAGGAGADAAWLSNVYAINEAGTVAAEVRVPQPAPQEDLLLKVLLRPRR